MALMLAQITDLHLREPGRIAYGRLDTAPYLSAAIQALLELRPRPDAVVLTGDLTDFGRAEEYAHLSQRLEPLDHAGIPYFLMPGNHDDREALRRSFPEHRYLGEAGFVQYTVPIGASGPLRLVALDTVHHGHSEGRLCAERLRWLDDTLRRHAGEPIVLAMHHPPFTTLIAHMDRMGLLQGTDELAEIVKAHPNVERIICGHLHRTIHARFAGTVASTAPSPAHQICLDLAPDAPAAWTLEPPGFHVHAWGGPGRLVTHAAVVGRYPGPYPFDDSASTA